MGTFDIHFTKNAASRDSADGLQRRCNELKAENSLLKHQLRAVRVELETLRQCLKGAV